MANTSSKLDLSFERLQFYRDKMEKAYPGFYKSSDRMQFEKNFLSYMLKKNPSIDVEDWLQRASLKSTKKFVSRGIKKNRLARFMQELRIAGRNIWLAPLRVLYQGIRLLSAATARLAQSIDPAKWTIPQRQQPAPGIANHFIDEQAYGQQQAVSAGLTQPNGQILAHGGGSHLAQPTASFTQPPFKQTPHAGLSSSVVQPNGQLSITTSQKEGMVHDTGKDSPPKGQTKKNGKTSKVVYNQQGQKVTFQHNSKKPMVRAPEHKGKSKGGVPRS